LEPQVKLVVRVAVAVMLAVDLEHQVKETKAATVQAQVITQAVVVEQEPLEATHLQQQLVAQVEMVQYLQLQAQVLPMLVVAVEVLILVVLVFLGLAVQAAGVEVHLEVEHLQLVAQLILAAVVVEEAILVKMVQTAVLA
jgi:hypothetical protein